MAESLQFSIGADTANFQSGIGSALGALAGLAAAFVSVQAIVEAFSEAIDLGSRLNDLSTRTGETAGTLAVLERAFENTGVGADKLGPAIGRMQKTMIDMASGSDSATLAFQQLGLTWADLDGKSPAEQMQLIGQRLAAIVDPALRAETAMEIFGKSGAELLPILINFGIETEAAKNQLGSLPELLDKSAYSVDSLGDNLDAISNKLTEMAYGFLSEVVPAVEMFTSKLAGIDAASIGVGLADALVGAFVAPMQAAGLLGDTLLLGVKMMGNELVYQVRYWSELMFNTFSTISSDIIPILGNNMTGAFAMAVGSLGDSLAGVLAPVADMLGLESLQELAAASQDLMVQGAAKIQDSANAFAVAFEEAKLKSTIVREDFFGAEGSSQKIASDFASLQQSARDAMDEFLVDTSDLAAGRTTSQSDTTLLDTINAIDEVNQTPLQEGKSGGGGPPAKTPAQMQSEMNRQLQLIADSGQGTAIGPAQSAQQVLDMQKELATLEALGKGGTAEADALRSSIETHTDIAFSNTITPADEEIARQWALNEWAKGTTELGMTELQELAEQNILEQKKQDQATQKKKLEEGKGGGSGSKPPVSLQAIVQSIQMLLQKIEPKLPQHIMS